MTNYSFSPKRFLLIGCGGIAGQHALAIESHPDKLSLPMVCDANPAQAASYAERFGAEAFGEYRKALNAAIGRVDGVVATLPHFLHAEVAKSALERGLPILMEKPVVCSLEELRTLQALERPGVFVQAGQMQRFGSEENWLRWWLRESGEFGDPRLFNLDIYQNIHGYVGTNPNHWILDKKTAGGGIVISVGVHILDLLRYWFDQDYTEVFASGRFDAPLKNGAESTVAATLKLSDGMIGTLNCSYTAARVPYSQRSLVFGTRGTLYQHMPQPGGGYMGPFYISTDGGQPSLEWGMMYKGFRSVSECRAGQQDVAAFTEQMLSFAESIELGRAKENSLARNLNTIAVMEAISRSLQSGKPESVSTV